MSASCCSKWMIWGGGGGVRQDLHLFSCAHSLSRQCTGKCWYPFSGVTSSGRVWRMVLGSDAWSVYSSLIWETGLQVWDFCSAGPVRALHAKPLRGMTSLLGLRWLCLLVV